MSLPQIIGANVAGTTAMGAGFSCAVRVLFLEMCDVAQS
jgi:hypothetical protein